METQTTSMRDILQNKIDATVQAAQHSAMPVVNAIEEEGLAMQDTLIQVGGAKIAAPFSANGHINAVINKTDYTMHEHAIKQLAARLGVPPGYLVGLATSSEEWQRLLAAQILNEHICLNPEDRLLVRAVGGEIRGIVSDRYRRLNTPYIYAQFISGARNNGGSIIGAFKDDTRSWIETIHPEILPVPTKNNGTVYMVFGTRISSSDFGDGALEMRAFAMQAICLNGLVTKSVMREIHLGGRIPEDIKVSNKTYRLDTEAQASLVADMVAGFFSPASIRVRAMHIQNASLNEIEPIQALKALPALGISKGEVEEISSILMANNGDDGVSGKATTWKLTQAITAHARAAAPRRRRELEEIAGELFERVQ